MWTVDRCIVYTGIRLLLLIHSFSFSFFFLFNFQTLIFFVALFSETVMPIKLTLDTNMDNGWMYCVHRSQAATSYFFLSIVQTFKILVALFSGPVRPKKFQLGTPIDNRWMYRVYQNQAAAAYLSLYFFNFLSLHLSNINNFRHIFLRNCVRIRIVTGETPKRQSLTRTCD